MDSTQDLPGSLDSSQSSIVPKEGGPAQEHPQNTQYGHSDEQKWPTTTPPPPRYTPTGQQMPNGTWVVTQPQRAVNHVQDHMMFNIILTLFCCWPIGLFAIMKSMACRDANYRGDVEQARKFSKEARKLGYWTLGVGIAFTVLFITVLAVLYSIFIYRVVG